MFQFVSVSFKSILLATFLVGFTAGPAFAATKAVCYEAKSKYLQAQERVEFFQKDSENWQRTATKLGIKLNSINSQYSRKLLSAQTRLENATKPLSLLEMLCPIINLTNADCRKREKSQMRISNMQSKLEALQKSYAHKIKIATDRYNLASSNYSNALSMKSQAQSEMWSNSWAQNCENYY